MNCPFCNTELEYNIDDMYCPNANCGEHYKEYAPHIWQALIDGKKAQEALKIATACLEEVATTECYECGSDDLAAEALTRIRFFFGEERTPHEHKDKK